MKLAGRFRVVFISSILALYLSGVNIWVLQKFFTQDNGMGPENPAATIWVLRFHAVVSIAFLMAFGYFIRVHIIPGLRGKDRKPGGMLNLGIISFLILTMPFLLYAIDEKFKYWVSFLHTYVGLAFILPYLVHQRNKKTVLKG